MAFQGILQRPESVGAQLGRGLGQGFSKAADTITQLRGQKLKSGNQFSPEEVQQSLISQGVDPDQAKLYTMLTTGGQTQFTKELVDSLRRGESGIGKTAPSLEPQENEALLEDKEEIEAAPEDVMGKTGLQKETLSNKQKVHRDLGRYLSDRDVGMTAAEKIRTGKERYTSGLKVYQESGQKLRSLKKEKQNIGILKSINDSGKLPKGFGRVNVDEEGNLKYPYGANPETQRYVKTLNEFSSSAKDSFGSTVTNFDLTQFMKRFPTLLNTQAGRDVVSQQMSLVNDINSVYYKNLKGVYDKAGGARHIDSDVAERFAEELTAPEVEKLVERFEDINSKYEEDAADEVYYRTMMTKDITEGVLDFIKKVGNTISPGIGNAALLKTLVR